MLSPSATLIFIWEIAASEAAALRSSAIEPEHFFIALCRLDDFGLVSRLQEIGYEAAQAETMQPEIRGLVSKLYHFGINPTTLRREIRTGRRTGMLQRLSNWSTGPLRPQSPSPDGIMHRSAASRQVFARAAELAEAEHSTVVTTFHLLAALLEHAPFVAQLRSYQINISALHDAMLVS